MLKGSAATKVECACLMLKNAGACLEVFNAVIGALLIYDLFFPTTAATSVANPSAC